MAETGRRAPAERFELRARDMRRWRLMGLAALAGGVAALAHAPFNLWPLGLLGLAALFAISRCAASTRRAFALGWAGGAGYFATSMFWIVEPFFVDPVRHGWMAPFALIFLAGGLALFWGAAQALAFRLGGGAIGWIAALTGAELARAYIFTGFPWGLVGYVWSASPAAQYGAHIGPHGLTAAALAVAVALWRLATPGWRRALPMVALCAVLVAAAVPMARAPAAAPDAPVIRLVQPNAPQHQKWDPEHMLGFFRRQLAFTAAEPTGERPPDLIVWPETAIPWLMRDAGEALGVIHETAGGKPVVLGLRRFDGPRLFNSAILLDAGGEIAALYDKYHLVPFGEYIPLGDLAARFGIHGLAAREGFGYSSGPGARLLALPGIGPALPLICYEAVFPQDVNAAPARPRLLLQLTNDAWFGRFSGPYQHLQQARMRTIEQGLPMVRVANTGISAMIDARGDVTARLPLNEAGYVDAPLPRALPPTLYSRSGDWPILGLVLLGLALAFRRGRIAPDSRASA